MSRYKVKRVLNIDRTELQCETCGKTCIGAKALKSHNTQMHSGNVKDTSHRGRPKGLEAWNKGLSKETDDRVLKYANSNKGKPSTFKGKTHTPETRKIISEKLSINNKGGRCKWFDVDGQLVQGTWERNVAEKLSSMGVKWRKIKTNSETFTYTMKDKIRRYTPDFYLEDIGLYLEIKGYWRGDDKLKMECVMSQHPSLNIMIIEKDFYNQILNGILPWCDIGSLPTGPTIES